MDKDQSPDFEAKAEGNPQGGFLRTFGSLFPREEWRPADLEGILASLSYRELEAGTSLLREGQACSKVPFVLEGVLRVYKTAESGREITLYRIEAGQLCILSSGCGSSLEAFPASVVAEKKSFAAFLSKERIRRLLDEGPSFRAFVLEQYSRRMAEVFELVEEVAFRKVDERLRLWLLESEAGLPGLPVAATHQELAFHVGSSREVVSRILKDWEARGLIEISRGSIRILPAFRGPLA